MAASSDTRLRARVASSGSSESSIDAGSSSDQKEAQVNRRQGVTLAGSVGWLMVFLGFLIGSRVIADNSFFTHFANGRLIWNGSGIPRVDPYSFSAAGEPVTVQSWLPSWVYVGLDRTLGDWSLRLFNGVLVGGLVASLWRLSEPARHLLPRVALVGSAIVVGASLWTPRPLLFGLVGFALVLHALRRDVPLWTLLPVMWIWVNSHGSFPIALAAVGAVGVGQYFDNRAAGSRALPRHEMTVFGWTLGGTLLGALNPLGVKLLWFPVYLLSRGEALEDVAEWQSPAFDRPSEWGFVALMLALVVAARYGAAWSSIVPGFAFVLAGLLAVRNLPLAAILLVWAVAPSFSGLSLSVDGEARGLVPNALRAIGLAAMALIAATVITEGALDLRRYPVEEVDWLEARDLVANPDVHLMQKDVVGNYLELRFGSEANVFMDDRFDFYPLDVLSDHDTLIFGGDYADVLERRDADVVLWAAASGFSSWLDDSEDWRIAFTDEDEQWIIACRVDSPVATRCS